MSIKTWFKDFLGNAKDENGEIIESVIEEKVQEIYYKELAIQTAITYIANALSKCEIKIYENNKEVRNDIYYTYNISPNVNENSSQLLHKAIEKMVYNKESLLVEATPNNLYCADSYVVDEYPIKGNLYKGISIGNLQLNKIFKSDEVLRLQLNNTNIKNLIDGLYEQYGELMSYAAKNYKKSNGTKYKMIFENIKAGDKSFQENYEEVIKKQLKSFMQNEDSVYLQFKGYDLQDVSPTTNKDSSDFRNLRKEMFEIVAQAFQIPVSLMLGNITNMNEIVKVFLTFCIDPIAEMLSEEITRKTYPGYLEWSKGNYVKVDTSTINHIDILDVAEKADKLIASGTCCIDEVREIIGFDKLNTEFSMKHFITKNYDTAENRLIGDEQNKGGGEESETY